MTRRLILASASPARLRLLRAAGMDPEVVVSGADEDDVDAADVRAAVSTLARRKADTVAARPETAGAIVLGCDSLLELDGEVHGKPTSADEAVERWRRMRGSKGTLLTGHCVIDTDTDQTASDVAATTVRFGTPTDAEIDAYVATGEPLHVAGAFTLDGRSAPFVDGVDGDPGNVIGVSLPLLRQLLARLDIEVTDLWR
ncbi:MAG: nucleoside triphosphate pyrophosphatase [Actinomycetota bacterium]|jgi:septum formation protein|nr:nucleoside triphosphate pyrophosphatase [Actinomycetota bacterium]